MLEEIKDRLIGIILPISYALKAMEIPGLAREDADGVMPREERQRTEQLENEIQVLQMVCVCCAAAFAACVVFLCRFLEGGSKLFLYIHLQAGVHPFLVHSHAILRDDK